jgi:hypothetical protein
VTTGTLSTNGMYKLRDNDLYFDKNNEAMCVFDVDAVLFDQTTSSEIPNSNLSETVAIKMYQNTTDKTCTYKCNTVDYLLPPSNIQELEPFTQNMDEPGMPVEGGLCASIAETLRNEFNNIRENKQTLQITALNNPYTNTYISESNILKQCIFDATLQVYDNKDDPGIWIDPKSIKPYNNPNTKRVTFTLDSNNKIYYVDYPGTDVIKTDKIENNTFVPPGCNNPAFDCKNVDLKNKLITQFNEAHTSYPKIKSIPADSGYTIADKNK